MSNEEYRARLEAERARGATPPLRRVLPIPEIARRYEAGESLTELARSYGVSVRTIRIRLEIAEVPIRGVTEASQIANGPGGIREQHRSS